jgi:hypothetical protein
MTVLILSEPIFTDRTLQITASSVNHSDETFVLITLFTLISISGVEIIIN